jgi:hypothetical protein
MLDHAVETLATGTERIQHRLADACVASHITDERQINPALPPTVYALQLDLRAALTTVHDAERGTAFASAAVLSDEQCVIFARRVIEASNLMRASTGQLSPGRSGGQWPGFLGFRKRG